MNRKIAVTGASSEIGLAICQKVIQKDDFAVLHCFRNEEKLQSLAQSLEGRAQLVKADFSHPGSLDELIFHLKEADILINAAAITLNNPLPALTDEEILKMIYANNFALVKTCQAVLPAMLAKRNGIIINISSIVASRGNRGQSVYAGTKGFVESFTRAIAAEYGNRGIRCNCVAPGPIEAGSMKGILTYAPEEIKQSMASKRLGTPNDVAEMVGFLCTKGAEFINGKTFGVDGGFMRGV